MGQACIDLFVVTAEPVEKLKPIVRTLEESGQDTINVNLLAGAQELGDCSWISESIRVSHFPGDSVFGLRSRIPELAGDSEWVVVLEDHNLIEPSWPDRIGMALRGENPNTAIIIGAASNLRSTDKWSWANFLCVLGFHWAPEIATPLQALGFNVAIRREMLGKERLEQGEYESDIVRRAMRSARPDASFPVDHMQYRKFPEVVYYHWCNGRVTGEGMRKFAPRGMKQVYAHARHTTFLRQRRLRAVIRQHPRRDELPRGTALRTQLLAIAHSLGALYGARFGVGRAPWALE